MQAETAPQAAPAEGVEDPAAAAQRLERALDRIAAAVERPEPAPRPLAEAAAMAEVTARLDGLIRRVREALGG